MVDLDFESKFRHIIKKMSETGEAYAESKGQSWQMQELKNSVLSSIVSKQGDVPISRSEVVARASEDYKQYIQETAEAIKKELKLKSTYEMWKCSFEALRSLSSLEKKTRSLIDGE